MRCSISTGEYVGEEPQVNDCGLEETSMNGDIVTLFDARSTSPTSRTFTVAKGECALLTAYSTCGCTICIEKLLMSRPNLPQSSGSCECDVPPVPTPEAIATTRICNWCLGQCAEIRHICVQGTYRLVIEGSQSCLGCVTVTMERVSSEGTPIPAGLVLGATPC